MSLDGLRAWIGEVERKLGVRTRVMLALAAIAIGVGGVAIYLAIDTRETAVSEGDVRELQQQLESQIGAGSAATVSQLEAELRALQAEVEELRRDRGSSERGRRGSSGGAGTSSGSTGSSGAGTSSGSSGPSGSDIGGAGTDAPAGSPGELPDATERADEQVEGTD